MTFRDDPAAAIDNRPPTVLSIDDDAEISRIIRMRLEPYGVQVHRAFHGMHGFWLAMTEAPDVIITDVGMPQGDGTYIVDCLRRNAETRHIPVIVLTGRSDAATRKEMLNLGVEEFLTKPIPWVSLREALQSYVNLKEPTTWDEAAASPSS